MEKKNKKKFYKISQVSLARLDNLSYLRTALEAVRPPEFKETVVDVLKQA